MILALVALVVAVPLLWAVSVGAIREAKAHRRAGAASGCRAWVEVAGMPGRRYRCCEPVYAGGPRCLRHELEADGDDPGAEHVEESQAVARALVRARIGVPTAVAALALVVTLTAWWLS